MCKKSFMKMFKKILIKLLKEVEIQDIIRKICSSEVVCASQNSVLEQKDLQQFKAESSELERQNEELKAQIKDLKNQNKNLNIQIQNLEGEREDLCNQLLKLIKAQKESDQHNKVLREEVTKVQKKESEFKKQVVDLNIQYEKLQKEYEKLEERSCREELVWGEGKKIYDLYLSLPDKVHSSLSGIFKPGDLKRFIFCGIQPENMMDFWDFCKTEFNRGNLEYREKLIQIFNYFFTVINQTIYDTPKYVKQNICVGDKGDREICICTSDSSASGCVTEIILPGIVYASNGKVIKKSLVKIK